MIYTILLNSANGTKTRSEVVSGTTYSSTQEVFWRINWDDLFQNINKQYKTCRVKYQFSVLTYEDGTTNGQIYSISNRFFTLSASLANNSQGGSLSGQNTNQIQGTILGLLNRRTDLAYWGTATLNPRNIIEGNNLNTKGVDVLTPQGVSNLYVYLSPYQSGSNVFAQDYLLELQFFLDEDD